MKFEWTANPEEIAANSEMMVSELKIGQQVEYFERERPWLKSNNPGRTNRWHTGEILKITPKTVFIGSENNYTYRIQTIDASKDIRF
jgi:hypothetical protein